MARIWFFAILFAFSVSVTVQCPPGWESFGHSCYLFVMHTLQIPPMSWEDARVNCKSFSGDLVSISNSSEVDFIYKKTSNLGNHKIWIGLFRNITTSDPKEGWVWSDGTNFTNPQQWQSGEPNNYLKNEACAELFSRSKRWNDNNCEKKYSSICKRKKGLPDPTTPTAGTLPPTQYPPPKCEYGWESYNRSCYKFESAWRSWNGAKIACRDTGGHLVKVDSDEEQRYLSFKVRSSYQNYWIGLNDLEVAGRWVWESDKTSIDFNNWESGEPNGLGRERCVVMYGYRQAGFWNDAWCNSGNRYICEKEEGKNMCPENWVPYKDSCYQFNLDPSQRLSWNASKSACSSTGQFSSLVTIRSKEEQDFLAKQVQSFSKAEVWIGLNDIGTENIFTWPNNNLLSNTKFSIWANNGQPTENKEDKDCVLMIGMRIDGAWTVQSCALKRNFICMKHRDLSFCNAPLGMENGNIPDSQITASSSRSKENAPEKGRFHRGGYWCPAKAAKNEYLQIDLGSLYDIKKIIVDGNLTSFSIRYGRDGKQYRDYRPSLSKSVGSKSFVLNSITARFVRIYTLNWRDYPCFSLEFIGCAAVSQSADCSEPNWKKGPGNVCYQINKSYRTWTDARSTCLDQGADLLSIGTVEEKSAIRNILNTVTGVRSLWISLNDRDFDSIHYWSNGEKNGLFNWGSGSPSALNSYASQLRSCVEIRTSSFKWADISCNSRRPFICMKRDGTKSWGDVVQDGLTGVWMGSSKYYWPLTGVENSSALGTKPGKMYGTIKPVTGVKNSSNAGLQFSNSGSYIDAGEFGQECITYPHACSNGFTVSFMASFDSNAKNWQNVKILDSVGDEKISVGFAVYVQNRYLWFVVSDTYKLWKGNVPIDDDTTWRHYVMKWNESGSYMYINAQLRATGTYKSKSTSRIDKQTRLLIGLQSTPQVKSGNLNLAMVAFWERTLTEKDIASIYKAEFGRCPSAWIEYGMSCYQFNQDRKNFLLATKQCQSFGGDLVNIASSVQQGFVTQKIHHSSWIGVHDRDQEGVFRQTNNEVIKFSNWNGGEPNDYTVGEDCTQVLTGTGLWNDLYCSWWIPYICEKPKELIAKPVNISTAKITKFQRICHYSRATIGCPTGLVIKINSAFWGRRRKDVCQYISITNCGLDKIATTTKGLQHQCHSLEQCDLHASETESYLTNPCPGVKKYLEVNYTCVAKSKVSRCPSSEWKVSTDTRACYHLFNTPKSWVEAQKTCQSYSADLISIATSFEQSMATSLMERAWYPNVWTGLNDLKTKGVYKWSDRSPVTWTNWNVGQPDERRSDKSCVHMSLQRTKRGWMFWRDANCSNMYAFMCKKPIGSTPNPTTKPVSRGLCGAGLTSYSGSSYCYKVINQPKTWPEAKLYCRNIYWYGKIRYGNAQLTSIIDIKENDFIRSLLNDSMWIGLDGRGVYRGSAWSDDKPVSFTNWDIGQPDSYNGLEACVEIDPDTGYWQDIDCYATRPFVCKRIKSQSLVTSPTPTPYPTPGSRFCKKDWTLFKGMCYLAGNDTYADYRTWQDAESKCRSMNGHLTSISSDSEKLFLQGLIKNKRTWNYWIGLNDLGSESDYKWIDGTGYGGYSNWGNNEPNDIYRQEDCVHMQKYNGKWNDHHCSTKMSYICKSYNESYHPSVTVGPERPIKDGYCAAGWIANGQWCYEFHTDPSDYRSWRDAKDACERGRNSSDLGQLVSINDELEEAFITIQINGAKAPLWIGMNSFHGYYRFYWANGSPAKYFNWNTKEPIYGWRRCVEIVPHRWAAGRWNAVSCYRRNGYVCKTAASRTPITATPPYTPTPTVPPGFSCPQGYKVYKESCYKFFNGQKTFDDARKTCTNEKAELMNIDSQFKQAYLIYLLERFIGNVWFGLLHEQYSTFKFTNGISPLYSYWGFGQPNRQLSQRSCTQANITGSNLGRWDDVDCSVKNPFVCQIYNGEPKITVPINASCPHGWRQYDKFCYKHFDNIKSWSQAQYSCSLLGSNLVSIHDDQEQDFLIYFYQEKHPIWIWTGLNDRNRERGYKWIDNTGLNYVNWGTNEPNDHHGAENCVGMNSRSGKWNDLACSRWYAYTCKHQLVCSSALSINPSMITITESNNVTLGANQAIINDDNSNDLAWCTNNTSGTAKIKVDLNHLVRVTKISIQGRKPTGEFVKSFRVDYGEDGYWTLYTYSGFQSIVLGDVNANDVITRSLERPITLDSISITPLTWAGNNICMKFRLHGCNYVCQNNLIRLPDRNKDDFITAKSAIYPANAPKQVSPKGNGWCAKSNNKEQWIQVNFDRPHLISRIRTFGDRKESYVKVYKIQFSADGNNWNDYKQDGVPRIFKGNNDALHPMIHILTNTIQATYIRILPITWNKNICMRFTVHGCEADCDKALLAKPQGKNTDVEFASSDAESHPEYALFNSGKAWCTKRSPLQSQYLQIDFGKRVRLTKIATQGSPLTYGKPRQVSTFTLKYMKVAKWKDYLTKDKRQPKIFIAVDEGNASTKPVTNVFVGRGLVTLKLRIFPKDFNGTEICMRVEIYGCPTDLEIIPTTESTQQKIVDVSVRFTSLDWDEKLNDKKSEQFTTVSQRIENAVRSVYEESESFRDVKVKELSKGSVIAIMELVFNPAFKENYTQPLMDAAQTGKVGSLDVDKQSFKIIDLTPQASSGDKSSQLSGGVVAGIVITVLFIACLVLGGGFLYYRQKKRKQLFTPQHFDNPISYSSKAYDTDE